MGMFKRFIEVLLCSLIIIFFIPFCVLYSIIWIPLYGIFSVIVYIFSGHVLSSCDDPVSVYCRICHIE